MPLESSKTYVLGLGMVPFQKPGQGAAYTAMASSAARAALEDAGISYGDLQQAYAGYCLGDSACGQRALYEVGQSGIPIFNVNNNCATGASALMLARQAILAGTADVTLVVGFEEMDKRPTGSPFPNRTSPIDRHVAALERMQGLTDVAIAAQFFGGAGREHRERYGTKLETFAMIAEKARRHAAANPFAVFRERLTVADVLASPVIFEPLTRLQCCPMTCGAAAVVLCSERFARARGRGARVAIVAQAMTTDTPSTFESESRMKLVGFDMARAAAKEVYERAAIGPEDVDVVELHDCFTTNEILSYEALGLCEEGGAEKFVVDGDNTYGGKVVTNPSGGLLAKGHPLGATGVAQCVELALQLRGDALERQVQGARIGLQHNLGLGGACVVTMYAREA